MSGPHPNLEDIAEAASEKTVQKIFRPFGVDLADADSMREFGADLGFVRELRKAREKGMEQAKHAVWLTLSGLVIAGLSYLAAHWPFGSSPPSPGGH